MAESLGNYRAYGIPLSKALPLVFVAIEMSLQFVLDLTNETVQKELGITTTKLVATDWKAEQAAGREALTQALGRLGWQFKLEGLLVPSARRKRALNLILFSTRRRPGSSWRIQRARDLPKPPL